MQTAFSNLSLTQINRLFPFYFVVNASLNIDECGRSLDKIVNFDSQKSFFQHFSLMRPHLKEKHFEALCALQNQLIVLQVVGKERMKIRGQFEYIAHQNTLLFVGSPWFNDINELQAEGLSLFDFAFFDPLADLLQVVKNQQIATNDIKLLLNKIKHQKQALEATTAKLQANQTRLQLLSTIAEKTINGVIITDKEGRIEWINDSFTHISGYSAEEVIGQKPGHFLQGVESDASTIAYLSSQIKNGQPFSCEILNYHKNGSKYWIKIFGNPLFDAKGALIGFFALEEDITTRIQTEQALREAKEKSDAIAHSKNVFLTNMSHEMRTPLNAILGMGQQLQKTVLTTQQHFFLETINGAAEHLLVVINDILDISRVEAGKLHLESIDFDLRALINRCINVLSPKAEEKGLLFKAFIDNDIAPFLVGDPHRINQILLNLLSNALKFTEQGSVRLFASCITNNKQTQVLRFSVEDTGIGIDEQFLDHLFTEFSQEDSSIVRKYGGTGLGLNITKKLVNLMNGTINVTSKKNIGTTFIIDIALPIGTNKNIQQEEIIDFDDFMLKDKIILLVEDNEMNRILARTILKNYQVQLYEAENGLKALEILKRQKVDLVLMDMQMPVMDGIAATHFIRNNMKLALPILALTANALKGEREKCMAAGMDDYISKPFKEKELIALICKLLGIKGKIKVTDTPLSNANAALLYNLNYLNEIGDNNAEFVQEMIDVFMEEAQLVLKKMPILLDAQNFDAIRTIAHKIKSNLSMLAIEKATNLAQQIENEQDNNFETFNSLVNLLLIEIRKVLVQLKEEVLSSPT